MITIDPDSLRVNPDVLRDVVRRFDNRLCLNAETIGAGSVSVGDLVRFGNADL